MQIEPKRGPEIRGYEIVLIRERLGLGQLAFAQLLGVSERTIRGWENGGVIPASAQFTLQLVRHLAHVELCNLPVDTDTAKELPPKHFACCYPGLGTEYLPIQQAGLFRTWLRDLDALLGRGVGSGD